MIAKTVIYFTTTAVATGIEVAAVARLQATFEKVLVRNGASTETAFGSGLLETADYVAGTNIPAAYSSEYTTISVPTAVSPDHFKVFPAAITIDASNVDVQQLAAISVEISSTTGLATMTDRSASCAWVSSDTGKATVGASTGVLTAVAAGSTTVTATYTPGTPLTSVTGEADDDLLTKAAHGLVTGDDVLVTFGSGFTGLTTATVYYVIKVSADTFKLATTYANAVAGTAIDITADGTGATVVRAPVTSTCAVTVQA